jgi:DNA transposition AAA+ family ATPase
MKIQLNSAEFLKELQQFLDDRAWSITMMAKAAGISTAALSQFIADKYQGNWDNIRTKLDAVMIREKEKAAAPAREVGFVETSASKRVFHIARNCHIVGDIGVCYSQAGFGKTESVREYARQNPDVILIEADPGYTAEVLFRELRERLSGSTHHLSLHDSFMECCARLRSSGRLLIIDEAEQLPYKALEMVRRLHDKTNIGILMVGMPTLLMNLKGRKGEYAQLYSRVGIAVKLPSISGADAAAILDMMLPGTVDSVKKAFREESSGNARRLCKMVVRSRHIAHANNTDITVETVRAAAGMVKLEVMS